MDNNLNKTLEGILHFHSETGTEGGYWAFQDKRFITKKLPSFGVSANETVWDINNPERRGETQDDAEVLLNNKWLPLPDPMTKDPDYIISSLFCGEKRGNRKADKRLMEKYGFKIKYVADRMNERYGIGNWHLEVDEVDLSITAITPNGKRVLFDEGTPSTEPDRPYGVPRNGLTRVTVKWGDGIVEPKRLSNTLLLTHWSYEGLHILRDGDKLTIYHPDNNNEVWSGVIKLKQYPVFTEDAFGLWIHSDQIGIDREVWAEYFFKGYPAKLIPSKKTIKKKL